MKSKQGKLEGPSITAMIDQLNQYEIGNVTNLGLLQSIRELESEMKQLTNIQDTDGIMEAIEQYLEDDELREQEEKD